MPKLEKMAPANLPGFLSFGVAEMRRRFSKPEYS
jgi:hypothetical protein